MIAMEGYGRGEASNGDISVFVEIRASAHRSKDIQVRIPQYYFSLERRLKQRLLTKVNGEKIDVYIKRTGLNVVKKSYSMQNLPKPATKRWLHLRKNSNVPSMI